MSKPKNGFLVSMQQPCPIPSTPEDFINTKPTDPKVSDFPNLIDGYDDPAGNKHERDVVVSASLHSTDVHIAESFISMVGAENLLEANIAGDRSYFGFRVIRTLGGELLPADVHKLESFSKEFNVRIDIRTSILSIEQPPSIVGKSKDRHTGVREITYEISFTPSTGRSVPIRGVCVSVSPNMVLDCKSEDIKSLLLGADIPRTRFNEIIRDHRKYANDCTLCKTSRDKAFMPVYTSLTYDRF